MIHEKDSPAINPPKPSAPSPYDLNTANSFLRNTFRMEVVMSNNELRKSRPQKFKIKNFKRRFQHKSPGKVYTI